MRFPHHCELPLTAAVMMLAMAIPPSAEPANGVATRSTADGIFSVEQATRGKITYLANCSNGCHAPNMTGGEQAPALAGDAFLRRWNDLTVGALFQRIKSTMPQTRPQSLSDPQYVDIVAFILDANGMPSGNVDLATTPDILQSIIVNPTK